jgi:DNA-binding CsgD family transcriptional regulator
VARRLSSPEFIGRRHELGVLVAALERAAQGQAGAVLVGGEAGVGKSRLVHELLPHAQEAGMRWVEGDCVDLGDGELPYAPIVAALRALVRDVGESELDAQLGPARAGLARLLPELADAGADDGELGRSRLFEHLLLVFERLADETPLVLVLEDLHWADRSTRDLISYLARNGRRARLLLLATYRTDELHRRHPLRGFLAEAGRLDCVERVELDRFTRRELAAQLAGIRGERPDPRLVDDLFARSEGNAFFAEELLAAGDAGRLPDSLRDALTLRVDGLPAETQRVVRVAAAAGTGVGYRLLSVAGGMEEAELAHALRDAMAQQVLVEDPDTGAYGFRHALLREALYDDLLPGEREPLHAALARALERDPELSATGTGAAAELAYHWAEARELPAAFRASIEAGEQAEAVFAFAEARGHFERAIGLWAAVPGEHDASPLDLVELHARAAEAALLSDEFTRAIALVRRALELVDEAVEPARAALLHEQYGRYLWAAGQPGALEEHRTAVRLYPADARTADRARVLAAEARTLMLTGLADEALPSGEEALAIAREVGDAAVELSVVSTLGAGLGMLGQRDRAIAMMREAAARPGPGPDVEGRLRLYGNLGFVLAMDGATDEGIEMTLRGRDLAAELGLRGQAAFLAASAAELMTLRGRLAESEELSREALDDADPGLPGATVSTMLGEAEWMRGRIADARAHLEEARALASGAEGAMWTAPIRWNLAAVALEEGRAADARALVVEGEELVAGPHDDLMYVAPLAAVGMRAEAALAGAARTLGDAGALAEATERAEGIVARLRERLAAETAEPPPEAVLRLAECEAELARVHGRADAEGWNALADRWLAAGRPHPAAYALLQAAEATIAADGSRTDARAALVRAAELAAEMDAGTIAGHVEALARRARIDLATGPAPPAPADADRTPAERLGLTDRELDVLRLLAQGRTNPEIGAELFISAKTASVHVSNILAKLDVRSRVEAAGVAHRLGLVEA